MVSVLSNGVNPTSQTHNQTDNFLLLGEFIGVRGNQEFISDILMDTGCNTYALINEDTTTRLNLHTRKLSNPIYPILADKKPSQFPIEFQTTPIRIKITDLTSNENICEKSITFLIVKNLSHAIIFGLPWCREMKPEIDWDQLSLRAPPTLSIINSNNIEIIINNITQQEDNPFQIPIHQITKSSIECNSQQIPLIYLEFEKVFQEKNDDAAPLPPHRKYDMKIDLDPNMPFPPSPKIYPLNPISEKILEKYINKALKKGWIEESTAEFAAPIFVVPKSDGTGRCVVNYKETNKRTKKIPYPIPLVQELLDKLGTATVFTQLDLPDAYHLLRIQAGDEWKTAFRSKFGLHQFKVMSFGLQNCPPYFQYWLNDIFKDVLNITLLIYFDNLLIFSENEEDHPQHVKFVLQRLSDHQLTVNPTKCTFHVKEIDFLGYIVSSKRGIRMNPQKIEALMKWEKPTTVKQAQRLAGFANFYRRFILNYAELIAPLNKLLKRKGKFEWTTECEAAFKSLKEKFTNPSILGFLIFLNQLF